MPHHGNPCSKNAFDALPDLFAPFLHFKKNMGGHLPYFLMNGHEVAVANGYLYGVELLIRGESSLVGELMFNKQSHTGSVIGFMLILFRGAFWNHNFNHKL